MCSFAVRLCFGGDEEKFLEGIRILQESIYGRKNWEILHNKIEGEGNLVQFIRKILFRELDISTIDNHVDV